MVDEVRRSMMPLDVDEPAFENLRRRHGVELVPLARRWLAEWSEAGGPGFPYGISCGATATGCWW